MTGSNTALDAYLAAIEAAFTRRRGRVFRLVGPDFALARRLHAAGLPVDLLLDEWALACRQGPEPGSLVFIEARLLVRAAGWQAATTTPASTGADEARDPLSVWLLAVLARLRAEPRLDGPLLALEPALVALLARGSTTDSRAALLVEGQALADRLAELALAAAGTEAHARYRAEAQAVLARQRGRLDPQALALALARYERRRACEDLGLPAPP